MWVGKYFESNTLPKTCIKVQTYFIKQKDQHEAGLSVNFSK